MTNTREAADLQAYRQNNDAHLTRHLPPIEIYAGLIEKGRHVYRCVIRAAALTEEAEAAYVAAENTRRETTAARMAAFRTRLDEAINSPLE